jgi:hypothetical protein
MLHSISDKIINCKCTLNIEQNVEANHYRVYRILKVLSFGVSIAITASIFLMVGNKYNPFPLMRFPGYFCLIASEMTFGYDKIGIKNVILGMI